MGSRIDVVTGLTDCGLNKVEALNLRIIFMSLFVFCVLPQEGFFSDERWRFMMRFLSFGSLEWVWQVRIRPKRYNSWLLCCRCWCAGPVWQPAVCGSAVQVCGQVWAVCDLSVFVRPPMVSSINILLLGLACFDILLIITSILVVGIPSIHTHHTIILEMEDRYAKIALIWYEAGIYINCYKKTFFGGDLFYTYWGCSQFWPQPNFVLN